MTDTASHRFVDTIRQRLRWLNSFENAMDFSMDNYLLGRIRALEKVVSALEARIDGLSAEPPPHPQARALAPLTPTMLDVH